MRSTKAPTISAGVMMAKVIWNMKNTVSGSVVFGATASRATPSRSDLVEIADPGPAAVEGEAVGAEQPDHRHEAGDGETLHQHREQVLGAHEPAIEQRKPRQSHEQNQRRGRDQPGGIARVDH